MAFTHYANAEIVDVRSTPTKVRTASLDRFSDFHKYRTSDGYLYVRVRAISSRVNKNHDGWPSAELAGSADLINQRRSNTGFTVEASEGNPEAGFTTFLGKPLFVDHHNSNPKKARGLIVDAKLRVLDPKEASADHYWGSGDVDPEHMPPTEIELLAEVDAKAFPRLAHAIVNGDLDGVSMGCNVERTKCSHCGNIATTPEEFCSHVMMKGAHHDYKTADGKRVSRKSYENCYGCGFFELSFVFDPADETALAREIRSRVEKEGWAVGEEENVEIPDPIRPQMYDENVLNDAQRMMQQEHAQPIAPADALQMAIKRHEPQRHDEGFSVEDLPMRKQYMPWPNDLTMPHNPYRPFPNDPVMSKTAENRLPQEFMVRAPDEVDTLRDEKICPICGSDMEGETCDVCGYVQPPKDFDNPDLDKATEIRKEMEDQEQQEALPSEQGDNLGGEGQPAPKGASGGSPPQSNGPLSGGMANKALSSVSLTNEMSDWTPLVHPVTAARINQIEQPVTGSNRPTTNEPTKETVLKDQHAPVTSAMLTAQQLINRTKEQNMKRTADGPTPPGDTAADARVDVEGVGGVMDSSNESASKANAQVDVTGRGSTGVTGVEADSTQSLPTAGRDGNDSGFNHDKTTEDSGPTKTYDKTDGTEDGARDPVTNETLEGQEQQGSNANRDKASYSATRMAYDDKTLEQNEQQGDPVAQGGSAVRGTSPADPVGNAQERVNLLEHTTSPANNSGPTKQWTGTDGNGVTRQQDPVTRDSIAQDVRAAKAHFAKAIRTAEAEEDLGLIARAEKWNRVAALDELSDAELDATLKSYSKVKTAGLAKLAQKRTSGVTKVPAMFGKRTAAPNGFERIASDEQVKESHVDDGSLDSALFMK